MAACIGDQVPSCRTVTGVQDVRDGVTAHIAGGLGNQLFLYAAAYEQAPRVDSRLLLDSSRYIDWERYEFALGRLGLPDEVIVDRSMGCVRNPQETEPPPEARAARGVLLSRGGIRLRPAN